MQAADEVDLTRGIIPLGPTRPAMVPRIGLPFLAALPLCFVGVQIAMALTGLQGIAAGLIVMACIGLPLRLWVSYDWYAVNVLMTFIQTACRSLDSHTYGGSTVSHFPLHPKNRRNIIRGIGHV